LILQAFIELDFVFVLGNMPILTTFQLFDIRQIVESVSRVRIFHFVQLD